MLSGGIFLLFKQNILPFISFSKLHFSQASQKKIAFYYFRNIPVFNFWAWLFALYRFLSILLYDFWSSETAFIAWAIHFTDFYIFVKLRWLVYIFTIWECHYLQCYIFIIFHLSQISEKDYNASLKNFFSIFYLSQIPGKNDIILP